MGPGRGAHGPAHGRRRPDHRREHPVGTIATHRTAAEVRHAVLDALSAHPGRIHRVTAVARATGDHPRDVADALSTLAFDGRIEWVAPGRYRSRTR